MMNRRPVSVIIPVHNCRAFLAEAVASVRSQGDTDLELIIVDDGSTDGTADVAGHLLGPDLRYAYQERGGPARARNRGLMLAEGDVIGFLDADDLWPADRLARQRRRLDEDPSLDVVLGRTRCVRRSARRGGGHGLEEASPPFVLLTPTAALFRRRAFQRVGGFDETLRYSEDTDWFMRARECGVPLLVEDEVTLLYRRHEANMTRARDLRELRMLDVLKRSLDRRRRHRQGPAAPLPSLYDTVGRGEEPVASRARRTEE